MRWSDIDWGSAPDWLAAIGTVGALFLGLILWRRDKRERDRTQASRVILWFDVIDGRATWTLSNLSELPIVLPHLWAFGYMKDPDQPDRDVLAAHDYDFRATLDPGGKFRVAIGDNGGIVERLAGAQFTDFRGATWELLDRKSVRRVTKRRPARFPSRQMRRDILKYEASLDETLD